MRPVASMVLVIAISVVSCASRATPATTALTPDGVRFEFMSPDARAVALAGSFNEWSASSHMLARSRRGLWSLVVPMPPGEHQFMFVVDGTWVSPPLAEDYVDDGFGSRNGVVVVR